MEEKSELFSLCRIAAMHLMERKNGQQMQSVEDLNSLSLMLYEGAKHHREVAEKWL